MILTTILWECNYYFSYYRVNTREAEIIKSVMGAGKRLVFQHLREWWHVHAQVPSDAWDALNYLTKVRVLANGRARTWPCIFFFFFFLTFWLCQVTCGSLVPWLGIEPAPSALDQVSSTISCFHFWFVFVS